MFKNKWNRFPCSPFSRGLFDQDRPKGEKFEAQSRCRQQDEISFWKRLQEATLDLIFFYEKQGGVVWRNENAEFISNEIINEFVSQDPKSCTYKLNGRSPKGRRWVFAASAKGTCKPFWK